MVTAMKAQKHTPGEWRWVIHDHSCASLGVGGDPGMGSPLVMSVSPCRSCAERAEPKEWQWGRCCTPKEADARLIAASPDMLVALQLARDALGANAARDAVDAAIAKATGK